MEPNSQPAPTQTASQPVTSQADSTARGIAQDAPVEQRNINDLNTEITEAEERQLVSEVLGLPSEWGGDNDTGTVAADGTQKVDETASNAESGNDTKIETPPRDATAADNARTTPGSTEASAKDSNLESASELTEPDTTVQTDDLWIEVDRLVKNEDGTTKTEKVKLVYDPENPGAFLPEDFQFVSDKQLFEIMEAKNEMAGIYKDRVGEVEQKYREYEEKKSAAESQEDRLKQLDTDIQSMIDTGILESPKAKPGTPEFNNDPTVVKVREVVSYMTKENEQRLKDGTPLVNFPLAYNMYEKDAQRQAAEEAKKQEIENKRRVGGMIGGSSAPSASGTKGAYVAGSHSSIYSVQLDEDGNLI